MGRAPKLDNDEILDRAMVTFWQRGWAHTSIRDLERALEMKAPSIYRRYPTKEALEAAVVDHYVDRVVRRRVDRHLSGRGDPLANLSTFLVRSVTGADQGQPLWGCLLTTAGLEAEHPTPELARALDRGRAVIEKGLAREVARAGAAGRLGVGVEPEAAVSTLALVTQGLMALARAGAPPTRLRRQARAAVSALTQEDPPHG